MKKLITQIELDEFKLNPEVQVKEHRLFSGLRYYSLETSTEINYVYLKTDLIGHLGSDLFKLLPKSKTKGNLIPMSELKIPEEHEVKYIENEGFIDEESTVTKKPTKKSSRKKK